MGGMPSSMSSSNTAASSSGGTQGGSSLGGGFNVVFGSGSSIASGSGVPSWFWMVAAGAVVLVALKWNKRS